MDAICRLFLEQQKALELFCLFSEKNSGIFVGKINHNQSQESMSSVYLFQNRSEYWTFPMKVVAPWISGKPNKEFDLRTTGSLV